VTPIKWLPRAVRERFAQLEYIAEDNPQAAFDQDELIKSVVKLLADNIEMGRPGRVKNTRELIIAGTPFIAVYRIKPRLKRIEILRFLHGAQKWPRNKK
jgi:toxin ParE1/3/4